jgi:hypothetical protein
MAGHVITSAAPPTVGDWRDHKGKKYLYFSEKMNWQAAEEQCQKEGGSEAHLVSYNSAAEKEWVESSLLPHVDDASTWTGCNHLDSPTWSWAGMDDVSCGNPDPNYVDWDGEEGAWCFGS